MMGKIFVSCASYRDNLCTKTLESLFQNAEFPERITVGICEQNADTDEKCYNGSNSVLQKFKNNIKIINVKHMDAKGPTWARYLCSTLFTDEDYFFQIDSHSLFSKGWDTKLIDMINNIRISSGNDKIVISHYPKTYEEYENDINNQVNEVPRICKSFFNEKGMISFLGAENLKINKDVYVQTPYIAAGMMFTGRNFIKDVPFDPYLDYLFVGEEILHSIRAWTSGYDIYSSSENIVYHYYTREDSPKIWSDKTYSDTDAFNKVKYLINLDKNVHIPEHIKNNIEHYGLGRSRTLDEYYDFAGIDLFNKEVYKNFCRENLLEKNPKTKPKTKPETKTEGSNSFILFICCLLSLCLVTSLVVVIYIKF